MYKAKTFTYYLGLIILLMFTLRAIFPDSFAPYGLKDSFAPWQGMSINHIFGTNDMGYDIFTEIVYATRDTLIISISSAFITMILAILFANLSLVKKIGIGLIFDTLINVLLNIPKLIAILVLISFLPKTRINIILLISFFSFASEAKILKNKIINIANQTFIEQNILYGFSRTYIALHSYLPNLKNTLVVRLLSVLSKTIMMESTLSFLGMGDLYYPSWGTMINFAYQRGAFLMDAYYYLLAPGLMIMLFCISFYFISERFEKGS